MYIKRNLEEKLRKYLNDREILAVIGPRQAGKTTLLQKIQSSLPNSCFLTFEDMETLSLFEENPKQFIKFYKNYKYIFIDEFQHAKNGGKHLKYIYDTEPNIKIILSGSSAIDITVKSLKFLVGRVLIFNLYQLDFSEFMAYKNKNLFKVYQEAKTKISFEKARFELPEFSSVLIKQINDLFFEYLIFGGYPKIVFTSDFEKKKEFLKNIYNTFFLREVRDLLGVPEDYKLAHLFKLIALEIGTLVDYKQWGQVTAFNFRTLKKYLNIFDKAFICKPVFPFFSNKKKELIKNPKFFFLDTGLRNSVLNSFDQINSRADLGFLLENFVFSNFLKNGLVLKYWRNLNKSEVDFVANPQGRTIIPIECKTQMTKPRIQKSLYSFLDEYKPKYAIIANKTLLTSLQQSGTTVLFLPYWLL